MGRVNQKSLQKLSEFFDSLPEYARNKCAVCNETLTHIVKQAEVKTGAGTATVTRELADKINKNAAPQDKVNGEALRARVRRKSGEKIDPIRANRPNKHKSTIEDVQTWTCIECGQSYSMDVDKCKCQEEKQKSRKKIKTEKDKTRHTLEQLHINKSMNKRKEAIRFLGLEKYCYLDETEPWPKELVGFIKRNLSKKYHPDLSGSKKEYQQFIEHIHNIEKPNEKGFKYE